MCRLLQHWEEQTIRAATLTDLGSTNGTQLNGERVGSRSLTDGDRITIGTTVIEFRSA